MATTLAQVAGFLDNRRWRYHSDTDRNRIITGVKSEQVEDFMIVIQVQEDGEYLALFAPQLLNLKDHVYKGVAFQTMLTIAWEEKLLRWEYDPSDGEVRTSTGIALADATLTEKQFNRLLSGLIQLTNEGVERLQGVLATGNDPGGKTTTAQMMAALREMLSAEGLAELEAQLQQLQGEGDSV
ncbi:MAG: hypothetical protein P5700_21720 [Arthrospira platensis PCC 7345]|uniref:hypothetical protein n=1 Tax=Limnospira platensis TaxID=118562 RepID=UPI0028E14DF7|nr:hypothetical protein [Arthrospira platensis PCC 7345]